MRKIFISLFFILIIIIYPVEGKGDSDVSKTLSRFDSLKARLIADGFDKELIERLYGHPEARFLPQTVKTYASYKENKLNYKQFLTSRFVLMGRRYLKQYQDTFREAYKEHNVNPDLIVALLIVESRLGSYTGKYKVFNTLSSLAVAGMEDLGLNSQSERSEESLNKLEKKGKWAYAELKAFLTYTISRNIDLFSIKGSFAGAFGIPQFVPSSLVNFGCDGDGDGVVDLYNHHDAIMSVANYLRAHGWRKDASREQKEKALFQYNQSTYYVKTILELSEKLSSDSLSGLILGQRLSEDKNN